jgi:hypothetical protein
VSARATLARLTDSVTGRNDRRSLVALDERTTVLAADIAEDRGLHPLTEEDLAELERQVLRLADAALQRHRKVP